MSESVFEAKSLEQDAPQWSHVLGYAGLIPFVTGAFVLTLAAAFRTTLPMLSHVVMAQVIYGAVILSFLGGVRWGVAITKAERSGHTLALSVVPALIAWIAALLPSAWALTVLAGAILAQGAWDMRATRTGDLPSWYGHLRRHLMIIVAVCLLVSAASVLLLETA